MNEEREERIYQTIIVDCYDSVEQKMGWYTYLEDALPFPFKAIWNNDEVEVVSLSDEEECTTEILVEVKYYEETDEDIFSVSLSEINAIEVSEDTQDAIEDWKYWISQGNYFKDYQDVEEY